MPVFRRAIAGPQGHDLDVDQYARLGFRKRPDQRSLVERVTGIEPALSAWEADVLPLNYTRVRPTLYRIGFATVGSQRGVWLYAQAGRHT
jgi:hypothetical protein